MSNTEEIFSATKQAIGQTVAELKHGAEAAAATQATAAERMLQGARDAMALQQGTLQAMMEAWQIMATGSQALMRDMAAAGQTAMTESVTSLRAISGARTAKERLELQANYVRSTAVWAVGESSRLAHAGIELAEKASAPVMERATVAAERFGRLPTV